MRAGDGGEVVVKMLAQSPTMVTVQVFAGVTCMGQLSTSADAALSGEGRKLILDMVNRGLSELFKDKAVTS